jgi:hypothetical protein
MKQWIGILCVLALAGCGHKDDSPAAEPAPNVQVKSVLGQATKPGVFPDGTTANIHLNANDKQALQQMTAGAMQVNQAIGKATPTSLQATGNVKAEAVAAFLQSPLAQVVRQINNGQVLE